PGPLDGYAGRFDGPWQEGLSLWTQDYPRADRDFSNAVRRLTRISARSVEQPVSLDDGGEVYSWPGSTLQPIFAPRRGRFHSGSAIDRWRSAVVASGRWQDRFAEAGGVLFYRPSLAAAGRAPGPHKEAGGAMPPIQLRH
ncbi:MAG: hypothetical protein ACLGSH_06645, partial [Acidobacteriota bacterium]